MTMVKIATVEVGAGGTTLVEFASIPQIFTDLLLKTSSRSNGTLIVGNYAIQFNSLTTSFSSRRLYGNGATVTSDTLSDNNFVGTDNQASTTANTFSSNDIYIPNYAGSTNKSFSIDAVNENNATTAYPVIQAYLWSNTAAITNIKLSPTQNSATTFLQYSSFTLYGITKGNGLASVS